MQLEDDVEGDPADDTAPFRLDGGDYEIDPSEINAEKLREVLRPSAEASRGDGTCSTVNRAGKVAPDIAKIRAWAMENGYWASDRGRVLRAVKDAKYAAH